LFLDTVLSIPLFGYSALIASAPTAILMAFVFIALAIVD